MENCAACAVFSKSRFRAAVAPILSLLPFPPRACSDSGGYIRVHHVSADWQVREVRGDWQGAVGVLVLLGMWKSPGPRKGTSILHRPALLGSPVGILISRLFRK